MPRSAGFKSDEERETAEWQSASLPMSLFHGNFPLFAKDENALLSREAHFLHLSVFAEQHGIVVGFRVAILPAPFNFGHHGLALLHGGFVAVDQQAVLTRLQVRLADFCGLRDANGFADGLSKYGHGQRGYGQQRDTAEER